MCDTERRFKEIGDLKKKSFQKGKQQLCVKQSGNNFGLFFHALD